jgi:DNA polymerase-1
LQNIPVRYELGRQIRKVFVPSSEDFIFADADYSQIELRLLAHMSGDETFITAFENGDDIHIVYGMGAFSLSKEIGVSVGQAQDYINRYLDNYCGVREYLEKTVSQAKSTGYVKTLLGRIRYIPEIQSLNKNTAAAGERIAKNTPIQGTAADIIKIAMIRVHEKLQGKNARLILQIHDELIVEACADVADEITAILREEMIAAGREIDIDLTVDVGVGKSWYEIN